MALVVKGTINPDNKLIENISVGSTVAPVAPGEIGVLIGDSVELFRQNEIINGLKWLYSGIRDRNLLDRTSPFNGADLYTGASIGSLTEANRRTASDTGFFNDDDIAIGMGLNLTGGTYGAVIPLESAVDELIDTVRDQFKVI